MCSISFKFSSFPYLRILSQVVTICVLWTDYVSSTLSAETNFRNENYNSNLLRQFEDDNSDINANLPHGWALDWTVSNNPEHMKFLLFNNPKDFSYNEEIVPFSIDGIQKSSFAPNRKTVFIIHGFNTNSTSEMPTVIKNSYLASGLPYNIIVVDWGKLSTPKIFGAFAYRAVVRKGFPVALKRVAKFIQFLVDEDFMKLEKTHLIGFSLGAHVSGGAGKLIAGNKRNKGRLISRITGLDPARPLFDGDVAQIQLNKTDADFVDVFHTGIGALGSNLIQQGHADFFPNGGAFQPGCTGMFDFVCDHTSAPKIYAATIQSKLYACQCTNVTTAVACPKRCDDPVLVGEGCPPTTRGWFYFDMEFLHP